MTRREKRRRMRRMLAGLFAAAAVLVPTAPAAIVLDDPADRVPQATIFNHDKPSDRAASSSSSLSVSEQLALVRGDSSSVSEQLAFVRGDGPDGKVSSIELRRDGTAAATQAYQTSAPQSGGGSEFDWTASGIGAASAALLALLGFAAFRVVSRHGMAQA
jgi:hypothetical protein